MKVIGKHKKAWIVIEIITCFCCLLRDGFFQIICIASFNFNLNSVEAESIISKQCTVYNYNLQFIFYYDQDVQKLETFFLVVKWQLV